jgi:hypothetical protein
MLTACLADGGLRGYFQACNAALLMLARSRVRMWKDSHHSGNDIPFMFHNATPDQTEAHQMANRRTGHNSSSRPIPPSASPPLAALLIHGCQLVFPARFGCVLVPIEHLLNSVSNVRLNRGKRARQAVPRSVLDEPEAIGGIVIGTSL